MNSTADSIKTILRKGPAVVVFTKVDGTERRMLCTLNKSILSEHDALPKGSSDGKPRTVNEDVVRAFDLEKLAWRSFRIDSMKSCAPGTL